MDRVNLEAKHLIGKNGNGKGCQRRHGEDTKKFEENYEKYGKLDSIFDVLPPLPPTSASTWKCPRCGEGDNCTCGWPSAEW